MTSTRLARSGRSARHCLTLFVLATASMARPAHGEEPAAAPAPAQSEAGDDEPTMLARKEFLEGAALVRAERWGEALAAFERATKLKPHAVTTFNIAQCERAMGQYTRARAALLAAIARSDASGELPPSVADEARGLVSELDRVLPKINVLLRPSDAAIAIDGRPLERVSETTFIAGSLAPAPGTSPNVESFQIIANPGPHFITVSRQGYQDVILNKTFAPGSTSTLDLGLDRLPASIHITSNVNDAIVRVNGADVGNPPVDLSRVAGRYHVVVTRRDFVTYEADVTVRPGEHSELFANMRRESKALTSRWWFWTAAGVLVAGAATGTYFLTRSDPQPQRAPTDGGGLGWSLRVP